LHSNFSSRPDQRHRRAQFVRSVGGELSDTADRSFEAREHRIQGFRESLQLVTCLRYRQPICKILDTDSLGGA
jgi:hypothetical protein